MTAHDDAINDEMIRIRQRLYMNPEVNASMRRVFGMTPETEGMMGTGASPYSDPDLASIAEHCTTQERNEAKVERRVAKSAAALLLSSRVGQSFDAIVTGASAKGTFVRVKEPMAEGKVVRGAEGMDVGDRVRVTLVNADTARGFIDFEREAR